MLLAALGSTAPNAYYKTAECRTPLGCGNSLTALTFVMEIVVRVSLVALLGVRGM